MATAFTITNDSAFNQADTLLSQNETASIQTDTASNRLNTLISHQRLDLFCPTDKVRVVRLPEEAAKTPLHTMITGSASAIRVIIDSRE